MSKLISEKYAAWKAECEQRFLQLKANDAGGRRQGCDRASGV